jgi:hypothetical protein
VREQTGLQNDLIENSHLPSFDIHWYLFTDVSVQAIVPIFKGQEIQKNTYLKTEMNTVLRVRLFQPAHAPLITELCEEILRISCWNITCLFFNFPLMFRVFIVVSVWNISDSHTHKTNPVRHA